MRGFFAALKNDKQEQEADSSAALRNDKQRGGERQGILRNLPCSSSRKAWRSCSWVFMTMGPY
jgi:hypothetical protein